MKSFLIILFALFLSISLTAPSQEKVVVKQAPMSNATIKVTDENVNKIDSIEISKRLKILDQKQNLIVKNLNSTESNLQDAKSNLDTIMKINEEKKVEEVFKNPYLQKN